MKAGMQISKDYFYKSGGFSNPNQYRTQSKSGGYRYYLIVH